jgi:hypothetical protein
MSEKQVFRSLDEYFRAFLPKSEEMGQLAEADMGVLGTQLAQQALERLDAERAVHEPERVRGSGRTA